MKNRTSADFMLIAVALIWGSGFIAVEYAINAGMNPMMIMAGRFSVAAIVLLIFARKEIAKITKDEWMKGGVAGLLLFLGFVFQTVGQSKTTISNSAFLTATNVVFVPFIVWVITGRKPSNRIFFLALMTFAGVSILTVSPSNMMNFNIGDIYVLICAVLFASHISYLGRAVKNSNSKKITFIQIFIAAVLSLAGLGFTGLDVSADINFVAGVPSILYLGLFSTCLCFFMQTSAQKIANPSKAGIILSTESLFGTMFSILMGMEPFTLKIAAGGLVIMFSVIMTELSPQTNKKEKVNKEIFNNDPLAEQV